MNGVIRFALGLANMPDATVADLDKALPGMGRLAAAAKQLEPSLRSADPHVEALMPLLSQVMPHLSALVPIFTQALPILRASYPDLVSVLPTVEELIAFVNDKQGN